MKLSPRFIYKMLDEPCSTTIVLSLLSEHQGISNKMPRSMMRISLLPRY